MSIPRKLRDLFSAVIAITMLALILFAFNDRLRTSVDRLSEHVADVRTSGPMSSMTDAAIGVLSVVRDFSVDNTFLFAFLVVSLVLVVLMLRV